MMDFSKKIKKKIAFYAGENDKSFRNLDLFKTKLKNKPKIEGFIFFTLLQFCYNGKTNIQLINKTIKQNYSLYFVRENFIIKNKKDLSELKKDLIFFSLTNRKILNLLVNNSKDFWKFDTL